IACHNPYPFDYFDEAAWNQMVVKCVFTGAPINSIVGLDQRRNPELLQMLRDLVSELHAAGRNAPDAVHADVSGGRCGCVGTCKLLWPGSSSRRGRSSVETASMARSSTSVIAQGVTAPTVAAAAKASCPTSDPWRGKATST